MDNWTLYFLYFSLIKQQSNQLKSKHLNKLKYSTLNQKLKQTIATWTVRLNYLYWLLVKQSC